MVAATDKQLRVDLNARPVQVADCEPLSQLVLGQPRVIPGAVRGVPAAQRCRRLGRFRLLVTNVLDVQDVVDDAVQLWGP